MSSLICRSSPVRFPLYQILLGVCLANLVLAELEYYPGYRRPETRPTQKWLSTSQENNYALQRLASLLEEAHRHHMNQQLNRQHELIKQRHGHGDGDDDAHQVAAAGEGRDQEEHATDRQEYPGYRQYSEPVEQPKKPMLNQQHIATALGQYRRFRDKQQDEPDAGRRELEAMQRAMNQQRLAGSVDRPIPESEHHDSADHVGSTGDRDSSEPEFTYKLPPGPITPQDPEEGKPPFAVGPNDPRYYSDDEQTAEGVENSENTGPQEESADRTPAEPDNRSLVKSLQTANIKMRDPQSADPVADVNVMGEVQRHAAPRPAPGALDEGPALYVVAMIAGISAAATVGIVAFGIGWYTLQKRSKLAADVDYPAYGVTGPNKEGHCHSPGPLGSADKRLAQSAQLYHYHHQKQQILAMENRLDQSSCPAPGVVSEPESDDENDEGDYTVYECPGLAPTGEMEVKNPMFLDDPTPATPASPQHLQQQHQDSSKAEQKPKPAQGTNQNKD